MRTSLMTVVLLTFAMSAVGQTSSLALRHAKRTKGESSGGNPRAEKPQGNRTLERHSLIAVRHKKPRQFKVHDLVTIIIREQQLYESQSDLEAQKEFDLQTQIEALFEPVDGTLGAATFSRGRPNIDVNFRAETENEADKEREDRFTTRITAEIIDVKPNGNLVLQARARTVFEDEVSDVTLTGVVRGEDVTPDNTVLSTQLADKNIEVQNAGAVRDGSRRGWIPRFFDLLRPF